MDKPRNGERILIRVRHRSKATGGFTKWEEATLPATYWDDPFPSESGHFHGNFGVADQDCLRKYVKVLSWVGFSVPAHRQVKKRG